jgi:hypothetical protein
MEKRNGYRVLVGKPEGKRQLERCRRGWKNDIVKYLINALPGGSSVDAVRYATVEEAVIFRVSIRLVQEQ